MIKDIEVIEDHRVGDQVNVRVIGSDYNRYVPCADWDADPEAIAATIADYLANIPTPPVFVPSKGATPISLRREEVQSKLTAMANAMANAKANFAAAAIAKAAAVVIEEEIAATGLLKDTP